MAHLTRIGNSRGIRIPKAIITQAGIEGRELAFRVVDEGLLIKVVEPRAGWEEAFREMRAAGDDELLLDDAAGNDFDDKEWEW